MTGEQFKAIRKLFKFNQVNLALMMGISRRTVQEIELSDTVKMVYQHSILWIALRDYQMKFDANFELIVDLRPDWMQAM